MIPGLIEVLSMVLAQCVGLWVIFVALPDPSGAALAYVFGIAMGGLGSRIAAIWRERESERPCAAGSK